MKKGWKVFWIVCAVMAAAGIAMTVTGIALGGLAMLSNADEAGPVHDWLQRTGRRVETENTVPDGEMITAYEGIDEISLDLSNLGIVVTPSDSEAVIVDTSQLRSDIREDVVISQNGGELEMETDGHSGFHWNADDPGMLYISIPRGAYYNSFSADVGAGQIIAEGFCTDVLEADCGAGQISLQGEVLRTADLNCDVGEVLFTLPGGMEVYNYELSCSAGELIVGDEAYSGIRNDMKIDNGSSCLIEAECRIGRMEIMFE